MKVKGFVNKTCWNKWKAINKSITHSDTRTTNSSTVNDFMAFICSLIHIHHPQHTLSKTLHLQHIINILNFTELNPGQYTPLLTLTLRGNKEIERKRHSKSQQRRDETFDLKWSERRLENWFIAAILWTLWKLQRAQKNELASPPRACAGSLRVRRVAPTSIDMHLGDRWIGYP